MARKTNSEIHSIHLHQFLRKIHLREPITAVGKSLDDLVSVIVEPEYYNPTLNCHTMCDYLFLFRDNYCVPGELKSGFHQQIKAKKQLRAGKEYAIDILNQSVDTGLLLTYSKGTYDFRKYRI